AFALSEAVFSGALFSGALASGATVDVAAGATPPLGAPCGNAAPAGCNRSVAADAATTKCDNFRIENSRSVSGRILLCPQPPAHRDFGEVDGHGLALPGPAAGREDESHPAALPVRTERGAGGWLGIGHADHDAAYQGQRDGGGGENEVFAGP